MWHDAWHVITSLIPCMCGSVVVKTLCLWTVWNIPKFKDRANWSHDTFRPMRRHPCVYQQTNQNIAPVIKNFHLTTDGVGQNQSSFWGSQAFFKTFHEAYTIFLLRGQCIGSHIGSVSWNIQHTLWLISSFIFYTRRCIGKILVGFQGRWTSIYYFFDSQISYEVLDIFPWLSYRLTFIMLNVGMVDNLEFW